MRSRIQKTLPVAGASVTVRNLQTNEQFKLTTNGEGVFEMPSVPPGRYLVSVEITGFKKTEIHPVIVETARPAHIDVTLEVSGVSEAVAVHGTDAQVDVNVVNPEINTILTKQQLLDLPMIRNPFLIVNSLPGHKCAIGERPSRYKHEHHAGWDQRCRSFQSLRVWSQHDDHHG